jgi:hypothetical protein
VSQDPSSTKGTTSNADTSKKRSLEVLEQDNVVSLVPYEFITCLSGGQRFRNMYLYAKILCLTVVTNYQFVMSARNFHQV